MQYNAPISDKGFKDFNPLFFGEERCTPGHFFGPCTRGRYIIHYVISGKGKMYLDGKIYEIGKEQAFLIKPDDFVKYVADKDEPWHYIWIGFMGELAKKFDELKSPVINAKTEIFTEMLNVRFLKSTAEEFLAGKLFSYYSLLFETGEKNDYIGQAINCINAYYSTSDCTVGKIAEIVSLEKHYLARIFKRKTGKTVKEYITEKRMMNAKKMLENGYDVKTTATSSGYSDQFVFSKAFKNCYGVSPINYKKLSK